MTCFECDPAFGGNLWHCHEASVEHADGTTECLVGPSCELPHELHHWQLSCADVEGACRCGRPASGPGLPGRVASRELDGRWVDQPAFASVVDGSGPDHSGFDGAPPVPVAA